MSVRYAHCMSIRRTQQTVERLWKFTMEGQDGRPMPPPHAHAHHAHHTHHARQSPPPRDPEAGYKEHSQPELSAMQMQPPRLQGAGICSRFVTMTMCCLCVGVTFVVWSTILSMPAMTEARGVLSKHLSGPEETPKPRPIPAILRRFALIKRAKAPQKGADIDSVQAAFPAWKWPDALPEGAETIISDLALAISALVDRLDPPAVATRLSEPPRPIAQAALAFEPEPPNAQPDGDTEL